MDGIIVYPKFFRIILGLMLFSGIPFVLSAQNPGRGNAFEGTQWWLGLHGGAHTTLVEVLQSHEVFAPGSGESPTFIGPKAYSTAGRTGTQLGLHASFELAGLGLSLGTEPTYQLSRFRYTRSLAWAFDEGTEDMFRAEFTHQQEFNGLLVPLLLRYHRPFSFGGKDPTAFGGKKVTFQLEGIVEAGLWGNWWFSTGKEVTQVEIDERTSSSSQRPTVTTTLNVKDQWRSTNYGWQAAAGILTSIGNVRLTTKVTYLRSLPLLTRTENRFANPTQVLDVYDVFDDLRMHQLAYSMALTFPLKYVSYGSTAK